MKRNATKGYSLVEVLVAISVLLLAIVGPMTIAAKGVQSAYYAKQQATALFLAQEGIEMIVASRNDSLIEAVQAGTDLGDAWDDWSTIAMFSRCRTNDGCNFAPVDTGDGTLERLYNEGRFTVVSCSTLSNCRMRYDEGVDRARYNLTTGVETEYTRVVKLERDSVNDGILVEVEVSWSARVFGNQTQSVVLTTAVYPIYD